MLKKDYLYHGHIYAGACYNVIRSEINRGQALVVFGIYENKETAEAMGHPIGTVKKKISYDPTKALDLQAYEALAAEGGFEIV